MFCSFVLSQGEFGLARARINDQYNKKLEEQTIRWAWLECRMCSWVVGNVGVAGAYTA